MEPRYLLTTFVVDSLDDNTLADGMVTLREAIQAAETDLPVGDALAGNGPDTIMFAPDLSGTINLSTVGDSSSGDSAFSISTQITIDGSNGGTGIALDAGGNKRHFLVSGTGNLTLDTLTLERGAAESGGAINNAGTLSISSSTLFNNSAGVTFSGQGGAIYNDDGSIDVDNSTFSGNTAVTQPGNVGASAGGSIYNSNGDFRAKSTTFTGSTANRGGALFTHVFGQGQVRTVLLENSILANSSGDDLENFGGTVDARYSLIEAGLGPGVNGVNGVNVGNIFGTDPRLEPLGTTGGPTQTHRLKPDSPAINAGDPAAASGVGGIPTVDQRGDSFGRVVEGRIDMGATELQGPKLVSFTRQTPAAQFTAADTLTFRAEFDTEVVNVDTTDFTVAGGSTAIVSGVSMLSESMYDITVSGGDLASFNGTVGLDVASGTDIDDLNGFSLLPVEPSTDETYGLANQSTVTVSTLADDIDGDFSAGQLSLREAVAFAEALPGVTTIDFAGSLAGGTIALTGGRFTVTQNVTVVGLGADQLTISGENASRIFVFGGGTYALSGLDLANGFTDGTGGAINAQPGHDLTITDSIIRDSRADLAGGGISAVQGTLTLVGSAILNNSTGFQGGGINILSSPGSNIINTTISGNSTGGGGLGGGGIQNFATAGGPSLVTLANVTMVDNTAPNGGTISTNVTVGAISATTQYRDSIFSTTSASNITQTAGGLATNVSLGHNISSNGQGNLSATGDLPSTDPLLGPLQDNGGTTPTHALLPGSPAIDAGNSTLTTDQRGLTRPADLDSVANAAGGNGSDIGAFEVQAELSSLTVTTTTDVVDNTDNLTSLREAIMFANSQAGSDTVMFDAGLSGTITLTGGEISITDSVAIAGPDAENLTISGNNGSRIFNITDSDNMNLLDVEIRGLTLRDGVASGIGDVGRGGAVFAQENLTILDSVFTGNTASETGGALFVDASATTVGAASALTIQRSQFTLNQSTGDGGAIDVESDADADGSSVTVRIEDTTISGNSTTGSEGDGGGLYLDVESYGGTATTEATLLRTVITGNAAGDKGGGLGTDMDVGFSSGGSTTLTILDSDISGNTATDDGGGVYLENAAFGVNSSVSTIIRRTTITGNTTTQGNGGGIIDDDSQAGNSAKTSILLDEVMLSGNSAPSGRGGGFFTDANTYLPNAEVTITITGSTITGNSARSGGGIENTVYAAAGATNAKVALVIRDSTVSGNTAGTGGGGGLDINPDSYEPSATVATIIENSTISGNSTEGRGGGILNTGSGATTVTASTITGNTSGVGSSEPLYSGGGIHVDGGTFSLRNTIVAGNTDSTGTAPDIDDTATAISASFSLIGDNTGSSLTEAPVGSADASGNLIGGATNGVINPLLGPLADNGGPTHTHALLKGSPAIDAGGTVTTVTDGLLFNTGVDDQGNLLGDSVSDPNYTLFARPALSSPDIQTVPADGFPIPPWVPNEPDSRWIGPPADDAVGVAGTYVYRTSFDLSGFDFADLTFSITGRWASDNSGSDILINGVSTGQTNSEFTAFSPFTITTGYVSGVNTIDFVVQNTLGIPSPSGLIVDDIQLIATRVGDQRGQNVPVDLIGVPNATGGDGSDIGAYEAQIAPSADFDSDGDVDGTDFLAWQRGFGTTMGAVRSDGNSDDDGDVDVSDLAAWQVSYAQPQPLLAASTDEGLASASRATESASAEVIDSAFALTAHRHRPAESPGILEEPLDLETLIAPIGTPSDTLVSSGEVDDWVSAEPTDSADESQSTPWLDEDLLEKVFG
ncbi:MAG: choice-of-anchor Q domain-containing protein [Planctomycetota bacterium]